MQRFFISFAKDYSFTEEVDYNKAYEPVVFGWKMFSHKQRKPSNIDERLLGNIFKAFELMQRYISGSPAKSVIILTHIKNKLFLPTKITRKP